MKWVSTKKYRELKKKEIYRIVESLRHTPETYMRLYANYTSMFKENHLIIHMKASTGSELHDYTDPRRALELWVPGVLSGAGSQGLL